MRSLFCSFALLIALWAVASRQKPNASRAQSPVAGVGDTAALSEKALRSVVLLIVSAHGEPIGQGSGFLVSRDGKIVTNYHVVENADSAIVKFPNGAFYSVDGILASDPVKDIAVLKAAGKDFPFLSLGKSGAVRVGQQVIAIGSPLTLEGTVSNGIVSGMREFSDGAYEVIQTTAAVSPGSSGGALLNLRGEVIGITAFRLVQGESLNFAVPIDYVKPLLNSNHVTPLRGTEEEGIGAAVRRADERKEGVQSAVPEPQRPPDFPKKWMNMVDGSIWTVRLDGDHLYEICEESEGPDPTVQEGPWTYKFVSVICDTKKTTFGQWWGTCQFNIALEGPYEKKTCLVEGGERIISVSPSRIEGKSQKGSHKPGECPHQTDDWVDFVLIPKN